MQYPRITPAVLSRIQEPFDHPEWLFELKYDGFRGLAYVERGACSLVSRKGNVFRSWPGLCLELAAALRGHNAVLDGEVVCLDDRGRPQFNSLLFRRDEPCFAAFDCLWLDSRDLRARPLAERKRILRDILPHASGRVLFVNHVAERGVDLFRAVCEQDLEAIIAKLGTAPYATEPPSWIKIKNPAYSQAKGRWELFERRSRRITRSKTASCSPVTWSAKSKASTLRGN